MPGTGAASRNVIDREYPTRRREAQLATRAALRCNLAQCRGGEFIFLSAGQEEPYTPYTPYTAVRPVEPAAGPTTPDHAPRRSSSRAARALASPSRRGGVRGGGLLGATAVAAKAAKNASSASGAISQRLPTRVAGSWIRAPARPGHPVRIHRVTVDGLSRAAPRAPGIRRQTWAIVRSGAGSCGPEIPPDPTGREVGGGHWPASRFPATGRCNIGSGGSPGAGFRASVVEEVLTRSPPRAPQCRSRAR